MKPQATLLFTGMFLIVVGVHFWSIPLAFIVSGIMLVAAAVAVEVTKD